MASPSLMAFPDVVLIDRKAGQKTGTTSVYYSSNVYNRAVIWERIVGSPWVRIDPLRSPRLISSPSGDPKSDGVFTQSLQPGQVYQVLMYDYDFPDPNASAPDLATPDSRYRALITVVAILKDAPSRLIVSQDQNTGGTWYQKAVTTSVPTFFTLQVSRSAPFRDAEGVERFLAPIHTVFSGFATFHDRLVEPLLPGNDLFYLLRVIDGGGNWQAVSEKIRTKQRKVTVDFKVLHIINDGAANDTTGEFHVYLMEGNNTVRDWFFGDVDEFEITDRPDPGEEHKEFIPLNVPPGSMSVVLGPKDVTDSTNDVGILTRGLCYRAVGENDVAMNFFGDPDSPLKTVPGKAAFPFPTGVGEAVKNVPFVVRAKGQVTGVEFEYDVTAQFTVAYA